LCWILEVVVVHAPDGERQLRGRCRIAFLAFLFFAVLAEQGGLIRLNDVVERCSSNPDDGKND
jgi:hypothetical protein